MKGSVQLFTIFFPLFMFTGRLNLSQFALGGEKAEEEPG